MASNVDSMGHSRARAKEINTQKSAQSTDTATQKRKLNIGTKSNPGSKHIRTKRGPK